MTGDEFRKTCERAVLKHKMRKKIVLFSIAAWIIVIVGIEVVIWWPPTWIAIPVIVTCSIAFIVLSIYIVAFLTALSDEINAEKKRKEKEANGY